jgi:hypothetical protein
LRSASTLVLFVGTALLTFSVLAIGLMLAMGSAPPTPRPNASATPVPVRTPVVATSPAASTEPGESEVYVVNGTDFVDSSIPTGATLTPTDGGAILNTTRAADEALLVTYDLPRSLLPADAVIHSVAVRVCGTGEGDFWEVYGPLGAEPFEYEVTQPRPDGCWHFVDGNGGDMTIIAATMYETRMVVQKVEYTVTFAR